LDGTITYDGQVAYDEDTSDQWSRPRQNRRHELWCGHVAARHRAFARAFARWHRSSGVRRV